MLYIGYTLNQKLNCNTLFTFSRDYLSIYVFQRIRKDLSQIRRVKVDV